ncbi:hypothetical protein AWL63_18525 [Sphingomonas panacis]|uniref:Uncharacterized protein n=1 Tax=Sphingomonas panacis TaxID=1560345 RepID=A0A1B3ZDX3_9SPHN|nr:hypothetical protein AWL63_18525 [Sphingomonas panacis]
MSFCQFQWPHSSTRRFHQLTNSPQPAAVIRPKALNQVLITTAGGQGLNRLELLRDAREVLGLFKANGV